MIIKYGFIYYSPEADPATDRAVIASGGQTTTLVAVPDPAAAPAVAVAMMRDGAQLIELCGFFGPAWTAKVIEATGNTIPIGAVTYGAESAGGLAALAAESAD